MLVDASIQGASEVFRAGGGKSVLIGSSTDDNTDSFLLIPHSSEGMEKFLIATIDTKAVFYNQRIKITHNLFVGVLFCYTSILEFSKSTYVEKLFI